MDQNMNYEEFKQAVVDNIKDFLPEKYQEAEISLQDVLKNNDVKLTGVVIKTEESNIAPNIYLDSFYKDYENGADFEDVLKDIAKVQTDHEVHQDFDVNKFMNFDEVKDMIEPRLVNADENAERLVNLAHKDVEDLAVTYHVVLESNENGNASIAITNSILDVYGISVDELHEVAVENLNEKEVSLKGMDEVIKEMMVREGMDPDLIDAMIPGNDDMEHMYVLSNNENFNGATMLLSESAMAQVSEAVGDDFFILPSSRHECIIVPATEGIQLDFLENMVQEVNSSEVSKEDKLSDHVYRFDAEEKTLVRADRVTDAEEKSHERISLKEELPKMTEKAHEINQSAEKAVGKVKDNVLS